MSEEKSSIDKKVSKAAPKPAMATQEDMLRLESAISKLAVMAGQGNILAEFGIKRWIPSAKDTKRQW